MTPSDRILKFMGTLKLTSAEWYGQPFKPLPWIKDVVRGIYDNLKPDGTRYVREAYISVPRKNAKSMNAAALALYHAFLEGEMDGQIYIVASDRSNAKVVFGMLKSMIGQSKVLSRRCRVIPSKNEVYVPATQSTIKAMSSDVENKHGLSPSLVIYDELHTARNRELYDVMKTGMGARRQPLIISITTAGNDTSSFCYEMYRTAKDWLSGVYEDKSFYAYVREVEEDEDWKDPENWKKANPSWGITVKEDFYYTEYKKALKLVSAQNNFRRLNLNQWVQQSKRWLSLEDWDKNQIEEMDLTGQPCYCGLDLSSNEDLTSFVQVFNVNDKYIIKPHFFLPEETIETHTNRVKYMDWEERGYLQSIPGNIIDHSWVADYILELNKKNPIEAMGYDPYMSTQILITLQSEGINTVQYNQNYRGMNAPSKDFERELKQGTIKHFENPVLSWCINNVRIKEDPQGNIRPEKGAGKFAKIDGVVASIMACDLISRVPSSATVYEERAPLVF